MQVDHHLHQYNNCTTTIIQCTSITTRQSASSGVSTAKAVEVVLDVLANKTGYETDMLEMDMDLETELGVDSIKRVEILSDVQAQLVLKHKM